MDHNCNRALHTRRTASPISLHNVLSDRFPLSLSLSPIHFSLSLCLYEENEKNYKADGFDHLEKKKEWQQSSKELGLRIDTYNEGGD